MVKHKTLGIIFANMHDSSVGSMTTGRAFGSLPFGGRYRMIDFYLSALVNGGVTDVGVIMKENYHSLLAHLGAGKEWDLARKLEGLSVYPPFSGTSSGSLAHGKIGALYPVLPYLRDAAAKYAVMMDCDHVCNIDVSAFVNRHIDSGADVSVLCYKYSGGECKNSVQLFLDGDSRVKKLFYNASLDEDGYMSMNVMVMERKKLIAEVENAHNNRLGIFERDVLFPRLDELYVRGDVFDGYVRRISNIQSYYHATMSLLLPANRNCLFLRDRPVFTKVNDDAPVRYGIDAKVTNSLIADGCVVEGEVENSVLFRGVKIGSGAVVKNSILMQNTVLHSGANIDFVIADRSVEISEGRSLMGYKSYPLYIQKQSMV